MLSPSKSVNEQHRQVKIAVDGCGAVKADIIAASALVETEVSPLYTNSDMFPIKQEVRHIFKGIQERHRLDPDNTTNYTNSYRPWPLLRWR